MLGLLLPCSVLQIVSDPVKPCPLVQARGLPILEESQAIEVGPVLLSLWRGGSGKAYLSLEPQFLQRPRPCWGKLLLFSCKRVGESEGLVEKP